jgi:hypothetical protein
MNLVVSAMTRHFNVQRESKLRYRKWEAIQRLRPFLMDCIYYIRAWHFNQSVVVIQSLTRGFLVRRDREPLFSFLVHRKLVRKMACLVIRNWLRKNEEKISHKIVSQQIKRLHLSISPNLFPSVLDRLPSMRRIAVATNGKFVDLFSITVVLSLPSKC